MTGERAKIKLLEGRHGWGGGPASKCGREEEVEEDKVGTAGSGEGAARIGLLLKLGRGRGTLAAAFIGLVALWWVAEGEGTRGEEGARAPRAGAAPGGACSGRAGELVQLCTACGCVQEQGVERAEPGLVWSDQHELLSLPPQLARLNASF